MHPFVITKITRSGLMCVTGSESPVVVVLSGSMEPGSKRGDILFLHMSKDPIRAGEIVVFNIDGREIPIVHRVIKEQLGKLMNLQANCANILWCFLGKELGVFSHIFSYVYLLGL
ncbi:uncharacterized protein LOC108212554 [Daucus carota subsp. sativus]|uniref:uncharacterized protein LOC108212554 n=1 Tax=Daucus carota subsp. sativus TaxID=79200 RepID=UPI0030837C2A